MRNQSLKQYLKIAEIGEDQERVLHFRAYG